MDFLVQTTHPGTIRLDGDTASGRAYICELIRKSPEHSATPVLMMSDRTYPEDRAHAAEAGADAFLAKPFTEKTLRERIEALFRREERAVGS